MVVLWGFWGVLVCDRILFHAFIQSVCRLHLRIAGCFFAVVDVFQAFCHCIQTYSSVSVALSMRYNLSVSLQTGLALSFTV